MAAALAEVGQSGHLLANSSSCGLCGRVTPLRHVRLVIFNRVPKCGSSSLEGVMEYQAQQGLFAFERSTDFENNTLTRGAQRQLVRLTERLAQQRPSLYDRHVLHVPFSQLHSTVKPVYINLVREPLRMQLSAFYFWRQCACVTRQSFCAVAWQSSGGALCAPNYTIDTLYADLTPTPTIGLMTRWFCGHHRDCGMGQHRASTHAATSLLRDSALQRALIHLRDEYSWVGECSWAAATARACDCWREETRARPPAMCPCAMRPAVREPWANDCSASHAAGPRALIRLPRSRPLDVAGSLKRLSHTWRTRTTLSRDGLAHFSHAASHALTRPRSRARLSLARVAGVLERFEDSLRLLVHLLPAFFGRVAVDRAARRHVRPATNTTHSYTYPSPSVATTTKLGIENANDAILYREALSLLDCRLRLLSRCELHKGGDGAGKRAGGWSARGGSSTQVLRTPRVRANAAARYLLRRRKKAPSANHVAFLAEQGQQQTHVSAVQ